MNYEAKADLLCVRLLRYCQNRKAGCLDSPLLLFMALFAQILYDPKTTIPSGICWRPDLGVDTVQQHGAKSLDSANKALLPELVEGRAELVS